MGCRFRRLTLGPLVNADFSLSPFDALLREFYAPICEPLSVSGRAVVDAKLSYRFSRKLKVFVELLNLTEEPLREFTGVRSRENDFELYKWKAKVGVNFNL